MKDILEKNRKVTIEKKQTLLKETNKKLKDITSEQNELYKLIGNDEIKNLHKIKTSLEEDIKILTNYNGITSGDIYKEEEIKNICIKYHLRFLPLTSFKGQIPAKVAKRILPIINEIKKTNGVINYNKLNDFYVLAPEKQFQTEKAIFTHYKYVDPAVFQKINNEYKLHGVWGKTLTNLRRFFYIPLRNKKTFLSFVSIPLFLLTIGLIIYRHLIATTSVIQNYFYNTPKVNFGFFYMDLLIFFIGLYLMIFSLKLFGKNNSVISEENWNSSYKSFFYSTQTIIRRRF